MGLSRGKMACLFGYDLIFVCGGVIWSTPRSTWPPLDRFRYAQTQKSTELLQARACRTTTDHVFNTPQAHTNLIRVLARKLIIHIANQPGTQETSCQTQWITPTNCNRVGVFFWRQDCALIHGNSLQLDGIHGIPEILEISLNPPGNAWKPIHKS